MKFGRPYLVCLALICSTSFLILSSEALCTNHLCCLEDSELAYLLSPKPSQTFHYLVRYESFFSKMLGKEKGFFIIFPEDFYQNQTMKYPILFLLHGYNFHRRGFRLKSKLPEEEKRLLCEVKEEEYHWLLHENIAVIAYAMMDSKIRTYRDLEKKLEERFEELSKYGGLNKEDYTPSEIARSIVSHNLHSKGNLNDPFQAIQKMILVLPDGDNGFYTDENEGRTLYPETKNPKGCDDFYTGESLNYSFLPLFHMKPGALGKHESYFLELLNYIDFQSPYRERILPIRGVGGFSMGGFGAIKLGLKYLHLFQSMSSQSGLLDIELLKDKWMLKMILPEFLEIFGHLEPKKIPSGSLLDVDHLQIHNPIALLKKRGINRLPSSVFFDYGKKESFSWITKGNQNFEKALNEGSHQVPIQPFNGEASHNYQFWRSRSGNILQHHSRAFQKILLQNKMTDGRIDVKRPAPHRETFKKRDRSTRSPDLISEGGKR